MGNALHWQTEYLAREKPVLTPTHPRFVRKVRPLYRLSELETAVYAFFRSIDYVIEECPNSVGATQLFYKDILNRIEAKMPGTKLTFVQEFLRSAQPLFVAPDGSPPRECEVCGMPAFAAVCSFCSLLREVERNGQKLIRTHVREETLYLRSGDPYEDEVRALESVKVAVELGADVNAANQAGETALFGAAPRGFKTVVQFLADRGARVDARNKRGETLLRVTAPRATGATATPPSMLQATAALLRELGAAE